MARSDMFLKVTGQRSGEVVGESNDKTYGNQIELVDWSWGMTAPTAVGGAPKGRRMLRELKVVKAVDKASTSLLNMLSTNEQMTVTLSVRKAGGATPLPYFLLKLTKARLVDYAIQSDVSSSGAPVLTENLAFSFKAIQIDYTMQSATGGSLGGSSFSDDTGDE